MNAGTFQSVQVNYVIDNLNGLSGANGIGLAGTPLFATYSGSSISYSANTTTSGNLTILLTIPSGTMTGDYTNSVTMSGTTTNILIHVTGLNECQLNPSLSSFTQVIQQGSEIVIPKITFSPTNCQGTMVYDSSHMYIEGGIVIGGLQKPVSVGSIVSDGINLNVNTASLSSQTYNTKLKINAYGKNFEIPITIIVTGSSGVSGNLTESSVPTCSLTSTTLSINGTYSMICSAVTDIVIRPRVDPNYIIGTGRETSSTQYKWNFRATSFGKTTVYADFFYDDSPIGKSYSQEVNINVLGFGGGAGSNLNVSFFQNGIKKSINDVSSGETIFSIVDNYGNLVPNYQIILNGVIQTNTTINLESNRIYDLRITSPGYSDLVYPNFKTNINTIKINILPIKNIYDVGDTINISTDINASVLVNDVVIEGNSYVIGFGGNLTIKAVKEGYTDTEINISVNSPISTLAVTPEYANWGVGDKVSIRLDKSTNWNVFKDGVLIASNESDLVNFKIDTVGTYQIKSGEYLIVNKSITKKNWFGFFKNKWFWIVAGIVLLIIVLIAYKNKSSSDSGYNFQTSIN
jgi:hypothetical protein